MHKENLLTISEPDRAPAAALRGERFLAGARRKERSCRGAERPLAVAICSRRRGQNGESVETAAGSWREECGDGLDGGGALRWRGGCDERSPAEARRARGADCSDVAGGAIMARDFLYAPGEVTTNFYH